MVIRDFIKTDDRWRMMMSAGGLLSLQFFLKVFGAGFNIYTFRCSVMSSM